MPLKINEIFYSIQGESLFAGLPCIFIRLTGCNLRCNYCDTKYAYHQGIYLEIKQILNYISSYRCNLVEITGGEPLLQNQINELINILLNNRYKVLLETNGTIAISSIDTKCVKIMDIKCPSSGEEKKNMLTNLAYIGVNDQIKFVIGNSEDFQFAKKIIKTFPETISRNHIIFSPSYGTIKPKHLAEWILEDKIGGRMQLQLHKHIWFDKIRGV